MGYLKTTLVALLGAVVAVVGPGCSAGDTSGVVRLEDCPTCAVRAVIGWRKGGRAVVFTASSPDGKRYRYVVGADGNGLRRLSGPGRRPARVWTRSHERVAYVKGGKIMVRSRAGRWLGSPTSSCPSEDSCYDEVEDSAPTWSPDGRWLLFTRSIFDVCGFCLPPGVSFSSGLGVAHLDGSGFHWILEEEVDYNTTAAWSPDGTRIAFVSGRALYVVDVDRRGSQVRSPRVVVVPATTEG